MCSPIFKLETLCLHSGTACDRPQISETAKLPPFPQAVWQPPSGTSINQYSLKNTNNDSISQYTQETQTATVASQVSPPKGSQLQNYVVSTEQSPGNQTGIEPVPFINCSNNCFTDIQDSEQHVTTTLIGDTTSPPVTTTTRLIEEGLVRDEQTNEFYLPLTSTVVLKRKQGILYVPLDFDKNLTVDALVDSGASVSAIDQNDMDTIKQKAPNNVLKIDDPPNFQTQVANGQIEKPLATTTLNFDIADNIFAEHFVVMKKLPAPTLGLHFFRIDSVVIDTKYGLIYFPHLTMQLKLPQMKQTQNRSRSSLMVP